MVKAEDIVQMALDAQRYRFVREMNSSSLERLAWLARSGEDFDAEIDAAMEKNK